MIPKMSFYRWIADEMDGMEFDTYEEYLNAVKLLVADAKEELEKAASWACQPIRSVHTQMGVSIKELEEEEDY